MSTGDRYATVHVLDGWDVQYAVPTLRIRQESRVVFECHSWNPGSVDPREDALAWAAAVADEHSGLEIEPDDNSYFAEGVRYVRANAPTLFADEAAIMSGAYAEEAPSA